ncbi:hypothetical protein EMIT0194MI4_10699 [Pseudomonas sp. IT-194MI4]
MGFFVSGIQLWQVAQYLSLARFLWRGGLPPLGCEADLRRAVSLIVMHQIQAFYPFIRSLKPCVIRLLF